MSDFQLQSEITHIIKKSGLPKSKAMLCPIVKIMSMRHPQIAQTQLFRITKALL